MRVKISSADFLFRIGRCPKCMQESFLTAFLAWVILIPLYPIAQHYKLHLLVSIFTALCLSLSALWVLHITVYAWRAAKHRRKVSATYTADDDKPARRAFIQKYATSFVAVALVTSIQALGGRTGVKNLVPFQLAQYVTCADQTQCNPGNFCCYYNESVWCCQSGTCCGDNNYCIPSGGPGCGGD